MCSCIVKHFILKTGTKMLDIWETEYANIFVSKVLQQLEFSVCPFGQDGSAEWLHDLLDGDILAGELILC